jgi:acyl-CoA-binding protein
VFVYIDRPWKPIIEKKLINLTPYVMDSFASYAAIATTLQNIPPETQLRIYSLYKQATIGNLPNDLPRPAPYRLIDRKKYDAWKELQGKFTQDEAKQAYCDLIASLVPADTIISNISNNNKPIVVESTQSSPASSISSSTSTSTTTIITNPTNITPSDNINHSTTTSSSSSSEPTNNNIKPNQQPLIPPIQPLPPPSIFDPVPIQPPFYSSPTNLLATAGCSIAFIYLIATHDGPIGISTLLFYPVAVASIMVMLTAIITTSEQEHNSDR